MDMSSPQTPALSGNAAISGPAPLPTITRVVAVLVLVLAGLGLISTLSQINRLLQMRPPVLGMLVSPAVGIAFTIVLGAANLVLAILILRRYAWALDALIAIEVFGLLNNCLYLLSPARRLYAAAVLAQTQARIAATPGIDPNTYRTIMTVSMSLGIVLGMVIAVIFISLLAVDRRRYRAVCLAGAS
jgi:hypothetical protein